MQLIDHALNVTVTENHIEAGGYPISGDNLPLYEGLSFKNVNFDHCDSALVIHAPEVKRLSFMKSLTESVKDVSVEASDGLSGMARQAEFSEIPWHDIRRMCDHIKPGLDSANTETPLEQSLAVEHYIETPVSFSLNQNFGIFTRPRLSDSKQCLIIPNTGSGHCSGPNGLHTRLARQLASIGIATLRFDLRHLGSSGNADQNSNEAYTACNGGDVKQAVTFAKDQGFADVSLFGICAGAYSVFSYVRDDSVNDKIDQVFLVNANTLNWQTGDDPFLPNAVQVEAEAEHHAQKIRDPKAWLMLLASPSKWQRIVRSGIAMLVSKLKRTSSFVSISDFETGCLSAFQRTQKIHLIFSPDDIGIQTIGKQMSEKTQSLIHEGNVTHQILASGDHTFTRMSDRTKLIKLVSGMLDSQSDHSPANKLKNVEVVS